MDGDNPTESDAGGVGRRSFLKAAGIATVATAVASSSASAKPGGGNTKLNLVGDGDTIQEVHDSLGNSWTDAGRVIVTPEYDPSVEDYPIVWSKRATLVGGNYTNLRPNSGEYAIVVDIEDAPANRPPGPHFYNFSVTGGGGGIKVENARYTVFRDIDVNKVEEDGFQTDDYNPWDSDPDTDDKYAINSHHWYSCTAERCGRYGFYVGQRAHGTRLYACQAYYNGMDGMHFADAATACGVFGGSTEQNDRNGIRAAGCDNLYVRGAYVEANCSDYAYLNEIYVGGGAENATFDGIYGNGFNDTQWMFYISGATGTDVRNCLYRYYKKGMLYLRDGATETDVHRSTHQAADDSAFGDSWLSNGTRTRSDGVLVPQDLTQVGHTFAGDRGIHVRDDGTTAFCTCYNGGWYTHGVSELL